LFYTCLSAPVFSGLLEAEDCSGLSTIQNQQTLTFFCKEPEFRKHGTSINLSPLEVTKMKFEVTEEGFLIYIDV